MIGRAKSSIKLATGKWVFPESLEMAYRPSRGAKRRPPATPTPGPCLPSRRTELDAENVRHVFVHGDLHHDSLVAVARTKAAHVGKTAQRCRSMYPARRGRDA